MASEQATLLAAERNRRQVEFVERAMGERDDQQKRAAAAEEKLKEAEAELATLRAGVQAEIERLQQVLAPTAERYGRDPTAVALRSQADRLADLLSTQQGGDDG